MADNRAPVATMFFHQRAVNVTAGRTEFTFNGDGIVSVVIGIDFGEDFGAEGLGNQPQGFFMHGTFHAPLRGLPDQRIEGAIIGGRIGF